MNKVEINFELFNLIRGEDSSWLRVFGFSFGDCCKEPKSLFFIQFDSEGRLDYLELFFINIVTYGR